MFGHLEGGLARRLTGVVHQKANPSVVGPLTRALITSATRKAPVEAFER